jgi:hypothetical protein
MRLVRSGFLFAAAVIWTFPPADVVLFAQAIDAPPGWKASQEGRNWIYRPIDLPSSGSFTLTVESPAALDDKDGERWFTEHVQADAAGRGSIEENQPVQHGPSGVLGIERVYRSADRRAWHVMYVGFPLTTHRVLFCYTVSNLTESPAFHEYVRAGGKICGQFAKSVDQSTPAAK